MSHQKGGTCRSRTQKYQNTTAFKNDKYGASPQVKKANEKLHDGVCQRCKEILEWKVKYSKYKPLTQPRKCVKCLQKTVKDAYYIMCRPCALQLQLCAKCGKNEEVVLPLDKKDEEEVDEEQPIGTRRKKREPHRTDDFDEEDFDQMDSDCDSEEGLE